MAIERKIINCGENGTLARHVMPLIATGMSGEGIYIITGEGRLPIRPHQEIIDIINIEAAKKRLGITSLFRCLSIAVPSNKNYHMPITIYVGNRAVKELIGEINNGKYTHLVGVLPV